MSRRDRGEPRHVPRAPATGPNIRLRGRDIGRMMAPAEIARAICQMEGLDDADVCDIVIAGAQCLAAAGPVERDGLGPCAALSPDERYDALTAVADMSASRAQAWRRRGREMTWPELRIFLLGLRPA